MTEEKVFLSYVRDDIVTVARLHETMHAHGIPVWRDESSLEPGRRFKPAIRQAISSASYFVACFSVNFGRRKRSYMHEELLVAVDELRQRPSDRRWLIPLRLDDCDIPAIDIGAAQTMRDLQRVDLFPHWDESVERLIKTLREAPTPVVKREGSTGDALAGAAGGAVSVFTARNLTIRGDASFLNEASGGPANSPGATSRVDIDTISADSITFTNRKR